MADHDLRKRFQELLEKHDESCLEYQEKHDDAASGYVHLINEEQIMPLKIKEYLKENMPDLTPDQIDYLIDKADEWSVEMEPGHRFTSIDAEKGCCVGSWALEEVENQYEVKVLAEELNCDESDIRQMVREERHRHGGHCIGEGQTNRDDFSTFETYQATDACWFAVIPRQWFIDTLEEYSDED